MQQIWGLAMCALGLVGFVCAISRTAHASPTNGSVHIVEELERIEREMNMQWNSTIEVALLGAKAYRDFHVYGWALRLHSYKVVRLREAVPLPLVHPVDPLPIDVDNGFRFVWKSAAVLCHSLVIRKCFAHSGASEDGLDAPQTTLSPPLSLWRRQRGSVYYNIHRSQKINRIARLPQLLTSKDGLCTTLKASRLPAREINGFSFPCWMLPREARSLTRELREARREEVLAGQAGGNETLVPNSTRWSHLWILKPSRASEGKGIEVLNVKVFLGCMNSDRTHCAHRSLMARMSNKARGPRQWDTAYVVQPYLQAPLLHSGRKWDVRTYVLCSNVLPMRLYVFGEAIVRYASTQYSGNFSEKSSVLTNTFVGKRVLKSGVAPITGSVADLAAGLLSGASLSEGPARARLPPVAMAKQQLMHGIRQSIGLLLLTAEPHMERTYARQYNRVDGIEFRCSNCYHLLGIDLIAEVSGIFRVIEVNIAPDMSLSRSKPGASKIYDHTKQAVAYNLVNTVYARKSSASRLSALLKPNIDSMAAEFPLLFEHATVPSSDASAPSPQPERRPSKPSLSLDVVEYLLDAVREGEALGCFVAVYPSAVLHDVFEAHIRRLWSVALKSDHLAWPPRRESSPNGTNSNASTTVGRRSCFNTSATELVCGFDFEWRLQLHRFVRRALYPADPSAEAKWRPPFRDRCDALLASVPRDDASGAWAKRTHIFKGVEDYPD